MAELSFATLLWLTLTLVAEAHQSSPIVLDVVYSATGFCAGFMLAVVLFKDGDRDGP